MDCEPQCDNLQDALHRNLVFFAMPALGIELKVSSVLLLRSKVTSYKDSHVKHLTVKTQTLHRKLVGSLRGKYFRKADPSKQMTISATVDRRYIDGFQLTIPLAYRNTFR